MNLKDNLKAVMDRFEGSTAVLIFDCENFRNKNKNSQILTIPKKYLPKGVKEGDVVVVDFKTETDATKEREKIARKLLEDILNGR